MIRIRIPFFKPRVRIRVSNPLQLYKEGKFKGSNKIQNNVDEAADTDSSDDEIEITSESKSTAVCKFESVGPTKIYVAVEALRTKTSRILLQV